ncbi:MAG: hypothetical protein AAB492_02930 [Patescibacteria group bacterium]
MVDALFTNFIKRWEEVTELPPQRLGKFTGVYKMFTGRVKTMPWIAFFVVSALVVGSVYFFLGSTIVWIVTLLQRGF